MHQPNWVMKLANSGIYTGVFAQGCGGFLMRFSHCLAFGGSHTPCPLAACIGIELAPGETNVKLVRMTVCPKSRRQFN